VVLNTSMKGILRNPDSGYIAILQSLNLYSQGVELRLQFIADLKVGSKVNNYRVNQLCGPTVCIYHCVPSIM